MASSVFAPIYVYLGMHQYGSVGRSNRFKVTKVGRLMYMRTHVVLIVKMRPIMMVKPRLFGQVMDRCPSMFGGCMNIDKYLFKYLATQITMKIHLFTKE